MQEINYPVDDSVQILKTVKIGNQVWSADNIRFPLKGSVCYENNTKNCEIFGPLYTYEQALEVAEKYPGWRLPTKTDIHELIEYLGGAEVAGGKLKVDGSSGFNALMAGFREAQDGQYYRINEQTGFWTSTAEDKTTAWKYYLTIESAKVRFHPVYKEYGDSIRLLRTINGCQEI